jgi:predicted Zn finger-like uncharacterized protein
MRVFCPHCSAEHQIDGALIPLVGMELHCPQCTHSFDVTSDGEVLVHETFDSPGTSDSDPFAGLAVDLDLEVDEEANLQNDTTVVPPSASSPPPLPRESAFVQGDFEDADDEVTDVVDVDAMFDTSAAPDPFDFGGVGGAAERDPLAREPIAMPAAPGPRPKEPPPQPPPAHASEPSLSSTYHRRGEVLAHSADVVWTPGSKAASPPPAKDGGGAPRRDAKGAGAKGREPVAPRGSRAGSQPTAASARRPQPPPAAAKPAQRPSKPPPGADFAAAGAKILDSVFAELDKPASAAARGESPRPAQPPKAAPAAPPADLSDPFGDFDFDSMAGAPTAQAPAVAEKERTHTELEHREYSTQAISGASEEDALDSPFEITSMEPLPKASMEASAGDGDPWAFPELSLGDDPFAELLGQSGPVSSTAQATALESDTSAGLGDIDFDAFDEELDEEPTGLQARGGGPRETPAKERPASGTVEDDDPSERPTDAFQLADLVDEFDKSVREQPAPQAGDSADGSWAGAASAQDDEFNPDSLFDVDREFAASAVRPGDSEAISLAPADPFATSGRAPSRSEAASAGQPLLEEMDFASLLSEEGESLLTADTENMESDGADGGFSYGAFETEEDDPATSYGLASAGEAGGQPKPIALSDLEGRFRRVRGGKAGGRGTKPGAGLRYVLFGLLLLGGVGVALGQFTDLGYFGMNLVFPQKREVSVPETTARVRTDATRQLDDTLATYVETVARLEKELELYPNEDGVRRDLANVLGRFSTRYPMDFAANARYQRRLDELARQLQLQDSPAFQARQRLAAGEAEEAREALDRYVRSQALGFEVALLYGQVEMRLGSWDEAAAYFEGALELEPDNIEARYMLGQTRARQGREREARAAFEEVLRRNEKHQSAQLGLAELLSAAGETDRALELAQAVLQEAYAAKLAETTFAAHRLLAFLHGQKGDSDTQYKHLEEALSLKPRDEELLLHMASYLRATGRPQEAFARLDNCWRQGCESPQYFSAFAQLGIDVGNVEHAEAVVSEGLNTHPADIDLLMLRGELMRRRGGIVAARDAFLRVLEADPSRTASYVALSEIFLGAQQTEEAIQLLESGIERASAPEPLMARLAEVLESLRRTSDAQQVLGALIERDPQNTDARLRLAGLLKQSGMIAEALRHYEMLFRQKQMQPEVRLDYADTLRIARKFTEAERELRQLIQIAPQDSRAQVLLGAVLAEQNRLDEAETYLRPVVQGDARNAMALFYLGRVSLSRGQTKQALAQLAQALRGDDVQDEYRLLYAETLIKLGGTKNLTTAENALSGIITDHDTRAGRAFPFDRMTEVFMYRGQIRLELKRYNRARTLSQKSADGPRGRPGWLARKGGEARGVMANPMSHKGFPSLTQRGAGTARGTPLTP